TARADTCGMRLAPDEFLDLLLSLPKLGGEIVSPDLNYVAWTWYGRDPAADSLSADSRTVIVSEDKDGDERERLYAVDIFKPLEMRLLTDANPNYFLRGGKLTPDGRTLVYAANRDPESGGEIEPYLVYAHDLKSGERRVVARPKKAGTGAPQLNEQGTHILYTRKDLHPAGQQVWLVGLDGSGDRELFNVGDDQKVRATWLRDGKRAIIVAETKTHKKLGVWHRESGAFRWLLDDPRGKLEYAYAPRGIDTIVAVEVDAARPKAALLDPDLGVATEIGGGPGVFL